MDRKQLERDISKLEEFSRYYGKGMRRLERTGITWEEFTYPYGLTPDDELTDKEFDDEMARDAVERCVTNVSESLHHLSEETLGLLKKHAPDLDWAGLAKYRNNPSHDYPQVNFALVWGILHELGPYSDAVEKVASDLRGRMVSGEYDHKSQEAGGHAG